MIIKKFLAKTETEAIEMAKQELGNAAVVMNIKKVKPKGLAKLFIRAKVEVTAALDEALSDSEKKKESAAPEKKLIQPSKEPELNVAKNVGEEDSLEERLARLQTLLEKQMSEKKVLKEEEKSDKALKENEDKEEDKNEKEEASVPDEKKEREIEQTKSCKDLIYQQMIENEVDKEIADSIMEEVNRALPEDALLDQILGNIYQKIILMLGQPYLINPKPKDKTTFIFFLGSTGVGKTTTIAKIASKLKLEEKVNIALVTADTYRIAAVEQLKTYANILSVPLKVIYSPKELEEAMEELSQYDICLVDTAGRSHRDKGQMDDIRELIEQIPIAERQAYLVLNAGTKYNDLKEIASVYSAITDYSIIFTKLDETSSAGAMLNMKMKTKCPLSYVTWGQNVPDDIGEIDPQKVAKQLLGGNKVS